MPKSSRSASRTRSSASRASKTKSSSAASTVTFRERIENMYELHLMLLLLLTIIVSVLVVFYVKQQNEMRSLEFRLQFMRDKYDSQRQYNQVILDRTRSNTQLTEPAEPAMIDTVEAME